MKRGIVALLLVLGLLVPVLPQPVARAGDVGPAARVWDLAISANMTTLENPAFVSGVLLLGVDDVASADNNTLDAGGGDAPSAPASPAPSLSLFAPHAGPGNNMSRDYRLATDVMVWNIRVNVAFNELVDDPLVRPVTMTWNVSQVPVNRTVVLKSAAGAVLVSDMRAAGSQWVFDAPAGNTNFIVETNVNAPPVPVVTSPNGGEFLAGTVNVTATATDSDGTVASVLFEFNSEGGAFTAIGVADTVAPYEVAWDTTAVADGNQYLIRATATDDDASTGQDQSNAFFTVDNNAPAIPALVSPGNGTSTSDNTPTLDWADVVDPSGVTYGVEVTLASDPTFASGIDTTSAVSTFTVPVGLALSDGDYIWRVQAVEAAGALRSSGFSAVGTFSVDTTAAAAPTLLSPVGGDFVTGNAPTLDWSDVTDPSGVTYDLDISTDNFVSTTVAKTGLAASTYTLTGVGAEALANGTYSWRVRAVDGAANAGPFSATGSFKVGVGIVWWQIDLTATMTTLAAPATVADTASAGVAGDANANNDAVDVMDIGEPPPPAQAPFVRLMFPHPLPAGTLTRDIRQPGNDVLLWSLRAIPSFDAAGETRSTSLTWDLSQVPAKFDRVRLLSNTGAVLVADMRATASYQFASETDVANNFILEVVDNPPTVTVTAPVAGTVRTGVVAVSADASAVAPSTVNTVDFEFSADSGATFAAIASDTTSPYSVDWNTAALPNGNQYMVRATVSDSRGATTRDTTGAFTLANQAPGMPTLNTPAEDEITPGMPTFDWSDVVDASGAVTYDIQISKRSDFTGDPDDLFVTGLAASTFTVPAGTPLGDARWFWRVQTVNAGAVASGFTAFRSVRVNSSAPAQPVLTAPADLATVPTGTPTFTWNAVPDPSLVGMAYDVQVATDAGFGAGTLVIDVTGQAPDAPAPSFTPGAALADGVYFWHVRAVELTGGADPGGFSVTRSFIVDTALAPAPTLLTPANNAVVGTGTPAFTWTAVTDAAGVVYTVMVTASTDATFTSPVINVTGQAPNAANPSFTPGAALADGSYIWKVIPFEQTGLQRAGTESATFAFTVDTQLAPAPTLLTPVNNAVTLGLPAFTWTAVTDPAGVVYTLDVTASTDAAFASPVIHQVGLTTTNFTPGTALTDGPYIWKVTPAEATGLLRPGTASATFGFRVDTVAPGAPTLTAPANNQTMLIGAPPTFTWSAITDPSGVVYDLQVTASNDAAFAAPVINRMGLTANSFTPVAALNVGVYIWRVRAVEVTGPNGAGAYSSVFTFTILPAATPAPVATPVITPPPAASIPSLTPAQIAGLLNVQSTANAALTLNAVAAVDAKKAADGLVGVTVAAKQVEILSTLATSTTITGGAAAAGNIIAAMDPAKRGALLNTMGATAAGQATTVAILSAMSADQLKGLMSATPAVITAATWSAVLDKLPVAVVRQLLEQIRAVVPNVSVLQLLNLLPAEASGTPFQVFITSTKAKYSLDQLKKEIYYYLVKTPPPVTSIAVKALVDATNVETVLESLAAKPAAISASLSGIQKAYAYFTVTTTNLASKDIESAYVGFKIDKPWLATNSINQWSVALWRYNEALGDWEATTTRKVNEDKDFVYFESGMAGLSTFAIAGTTSLQAPALKVENLVVPAKAEAGKAANVAVDVTNISGTSGVFVASLWVDGRYEESRSVALTAGQKSTVNFSVIRPVGSFGVRVEDQTGTLQVTPAATPTPTPAPTPSPTPVPATFSVSGLTVAPAQVETGQNVTVNATVGNSGQVSGTYKAELKVNGATEQTKDVTVAAGGSAAVSFTVAKASAGTYTIQIGNQSGSVKVITPAAFSVSELNITPAKVKKGEPVTITAKVTNTGQARGTFSVELKLNGATTESKSVTLDGGASQTVSFSTTQEVAGPYTVSIGNQSSNLEITKPFNIWLVIGPILAVIVIALLAMIFMKRGKGKTTGKMPEPKPAPKPGEKPEQKGPAQGGPPQQRPPAPPAK